MTITNPRMQKFSLSLVLWFLVFASCDKVDITFERDSEATDPSLVYIDDYEVSVATLKTDSFVTSGQKIISLGRHKDPLFAEMVSGSYMELTVPANGDAVAAKTFSGADCGLCREPDWYLRRKRLPE